MSFQRLEYEKQKNKNEGRQNNLSINEGTQNNLSINEHRTIYQ